VSKTEDLDKTISTLNDWLAEAKNPKDRLAITDRLIRALSLKYKHSDEGKGGKFNVPSTPGATDHVTQ